jgi:hypothetical protein
MGVTGTKKVVRLAVCAYTNVRPVSIVEHFPDFWTSGPICWLVPNRSDIPRHSVQLWTPTILKLKIEKREFWSSKTLFTGYFPDFSVQYESRI